MSYMFCFFKICYVEFYVAANSLNFLVYTYMGVIQQMVLAQICYNIINVLEKGHIVHQVSILHIAPQ